MDKHMYIETLRQNLAPSVEKLNISNNFIFYKNHDSAHIVKECFLFLCFESFKNLFSNKNKNF